jgi:transcriptional regulator GlxA family with amidase domain
MAENVRSMSLRQLGPNRMLETSARSIEEIARSAGFGTPEALRRAFARRLSLSPREYRARFGEAV